MSEELIERDEVLVYIGLEVKDHEMLPPSLKTEHYFWCEENCEGDFEVTKYRSRTIHAYFELESDAMLFALKFAPVLERVEGIRNRKTDSMRHRRFYKNGRRV